MFRSWCLMLGALLCALPVAASAVKLDFEGMTTGPTVGVCNFYVGGLPCGIPSIVVGPGPNLGVTFDGTAGPQVAGGSPAAPSPPSTMTTVFGEPVVMNVASGFGGSLALSYTGDDLTLSIFGGASGTGALLATLALPDSGGVLDFATASLPFAGVAGSAVLEDSTGSASGHFFDDITIFLVPEPGAASLLGAGMTVLAATRRRRQAGRGAPTPSA